MKGIYRIPLTVDLSRPTWIEDIDLPLLLSHGGAPEPGGISCLGLAAQDDWLSQCLTLQWLPSARPSAIPGQRCCTLIIACNVPPLVREVQLLVEPARSDSPPVILPPALAEYLCRTDQPRHGRVALEMFFSMMLPLVQAAERQVDDVTIKETPETLEVGVMAKPFFTYRYNTKDPDLARPIFHPLIGPSGKPITQMGEVADKRVAHFHHTALWIAHQNWTAKGLPNCDNWQMNKNCTRINHVKFDKIESGAMAGRFIESLSWFDTKGEKILLAETRTVTVPKRPASSRVLDIDVVLKCGETPVTLNKTPYHLLAVRVLDAMLPKNGGAITNSAGKKNPPDGAPADWIDISGKLDGQEQGVALFDHPKNDRHPTPCLQFSGQTIGLSPTHKEPLTIEPGKEVRFRYRVLVHAGNTEEGKVAAEYEAYSKAGQAKIGGIERIDMGHAAGVP